MTPPRSFLPHDCAVLGVDPGKRSGWALRLRGRVVDCGELDGLDYPAVRAVVMSAVQRAAAAQQQLVLVVEKPPVHHRSGRRSFASLLGSGETRASWRLAWKDLGQPLRRLLKVDVLEWRRAFGLARLCRDEARAAEARLAQAIVRDAVALSVGAESAPAVLIAEWGAHAAQVAAVLPDKKKGPTATMP